MPTSDQNVSLSVWVYGFCDPNKFCWYSSIYLGLGEQETTDADLLSHGPGPEETGKIIEPILVGDTSKTYLSVAVALDHSIYTYCRGTDPYVYSGTIYPMPGCPTWLEALKNEHAPNRPLNIYIFGGDQRFDESVPPSAEVLDTLTGRVEMVPEGYVDKYSVDKRKSPNTRSQHTSIVQFALHVWLSVQPYTGSQELVKAYDFVNHRLYYSTVVEDLPGYPDDWEYAFQFLFHMNGDYLCMYTWDFKFCYYLCKNSAQNYIFPFATPMTS
ncbi:hypothetical protein LguiB_020285 [Lonicera macranthoides]